VPQWDGNADTLARWLNKINRLTDGSIDVHRELGKIVLEDLPARLRPGIILFLITNALRVKVNWSLSWKDYFRILDEPSLAREAETLSQ